MQHLPGMKPISTTRRAFLLGGGAAGLAGVSWMIGQPASTPEIETIVLANAGDAPLTAPGFPDWSAQDWQALSEDDWRDRLSPDAFRILRLEATERAGASPLNKEYRDGWFACAGCGSVLFSSADKYESGTGWPSFTQPAASDRMGTKVDNKLWTPRTEYHCARCGGHQGHVFPDGPRPTGLRWCNNGDALVFVEASAFA